MAAKEPRRFLIAVGVENYKHERWERLKEVPHELDQIVGLLTDTRFGVRHILNAQSKRPRRESFLKAIRDWAIAGPNRSGDDHLILYWTGHGAVENDNLYLVLPDTTAVLVNGLKLTDVVDILLGPNSKCGPVLLLLDLCFAGTGALDVAERLRTMTRLRTAERTPQIAVIAATHARREADEGVFAAAFKTAVKDLIDPSNWTAQSLSIVDIANRIERSLCDAKQIPHLLIQQSGDGLHFIRNPHHARYWPALRDGATQRAFAHLEPRARGGSRPEDVGWHFQGRKRVFADICQWLSSEPQPGLCRVSGSVGAGKSAVLGRLFTLSRKDYRDKVPDDVLKATELPPLGSVDCVLLPQKGFRDAFTEICQGLGIVATSADELKVSLQERSRCPTLLVDGLDESDAPERIADLLQDLAQTSARVIVGTRALPTGTWTMKPSLDIDLDTEPWLDTAAVEKYVHRRLRDEGSTRKTRAPAWRHEPAETAHAIAKRVGGNFLLASLCTTALLAGSDEDPRDDSWRYPRSVDEAFNVVFDTLGDDELAIRQVLLPLAYAQGRGLPNGPLWSALVRSLCGDRASQLEPKVALARVPWLVVADHVGGQVVHRLFHAALREHLQGDRPIARMHGRIAARLARHISGHQSGSRDSVEGDTYALDFLSGHLRQAGFWCALGTRVTESSWITRQAGRRPFEYSRYTVDVEEAHAAASVANVMAVNAGRSPPALVPTAWRLLWRSGCVALAARIPAEGCALLVRERAIAADDAIDAVVAIGDKNRRAIRLEALARVVKGGALDNLLNYSEGVKRPAHVEAGQASSAPHGGEGGGQPMNHQHAFVLAAALAGPEGTRLTERAMRTASTMDDYDRWIVIQAVLPILDERQLDVARKLIERMNAHRMHRWRSRAFAAYVVERAGRGGAGVLKEVDRWKMSDVEWWDATAAVLEFQRAQGDDASIGSRVVNAIAALDDHVSDSVTQIELATCLIRALPDVSSAIHRGALSAYLRRLRQVSNLGVKIKAAVGAGEQLPDPHGLRLLRWAKNWLGTWDANVNLYFTPRYLGAAFAHKGHLMEALAAAIKTKRHDYLRPKALASAASAATRHGLSHKESDLVSAGIDHLAQSPEDRLELRCTWYALLNEDAQRGLVETLGAERVRLGHVAWKARCRVISSLVLYARPEDAGALRDRYLDLVDRWSPGNEHLLAGFAEDCASAGYVDLVCAALDRLNPNVRSFVFGQVLEKADDDAMGPLLRELVRNPSQFGGAIDEYSAAAGLLTRAISRAPADVLCELEAAKEVRCGIVSFGALDAALAVRAFELGEEGLVDRVFPGCIYNPLTFLDSSRRLPVERRSAFIQLLSPHFDRLANAPPPEHRGLAFDWQAHAILVRTLADALCATATRKVAASADLAEVLMHKTAWTAGAWLDILTQEDQVRVAAASFDRKDYDSIAEPPAFLGGESNLKWQLPLLDAARIDRLVEWALRLRRRSDHDHEEALLLLLPRYAAIRGPQAALSLRRKVVRPDTQALSWAAVFESLTGDERDSALAQMLPDQSYASDKVELALGRIAPLLRGNGLIKAIRWIVAHNAGPSASVLVPLVESAARLDCGQAYAAWEAVLTEASLLDAEDAVEHLCVAIPLAARLGGEQALVDLERALERASAQWP